MIVRVKAPNAFLRKNDIPNNEKNAYDGNGEKNRFPPPYKMHSFFKTVRKRNNKGGYI
jgi:hypothetical protein